MQPVPTRSTPLAAPLLALGSSDSNVPDRYPRNKDVFDCDRNHFRNGYAIRYEQQKQAYQTNDTKKCIELGLKQRAVYLLEGVVCLPLELISSLFFCLNATCLSTCCLPSMYACSKCDQNLKSISLQDLITKTISATKTYFSLSLFQFTDVVYTVIKFPFNITCPEFLSALGQHRVDSHIGRMDTTLNQERVELEKEFQDIFAEEYEKNFGSGSNEVFQV